MTVRSSLFNDHEKKPMRSLIRIVVMVAVSLITITICSGGYTDKNAVVFVGSLAVVFWGLPLIGLERTLGPYARYPIALIGLFPSFLVASLGGRGDPVFIRIIVFSGLAWSVAWLATSRIFSIVPHKEIRGPADS